MGAQKKADDSALGLDDTADCSPAVQEMTASLVSKMSVGEASQVLERLTGERERWGQSAARHPKGAEPECGHWVYTGHLFPAQPPRADRRRPASW